MIVKPGLMALTMVILGSAFHLEEAIIIAVAIIVGLFTLVRGRADVWKSNYEAERDRADRLDKTVKEKNDRLLEAEKRLSALEAVPSIEKLYEIVSGHNASEQVVWERVTGALAQVTSQLDNIAAKIAKETT